ncbi:MAG: STAS domain-containing protein [Candidatus Acidiferrales bacterium]
MILTIEDRRIEPAVAVLELSGKLMMGEESGQLESRIENLLRSNEKKFVLDLSGLTQIDSTGIGIILHCYGKLSAAGAELRVAGASGPVDKTLRLSRVNTIVGFFPTAAEAARTFGSPFD